MKTLNEKSIFFKSVLVVLVVFLFISSCKKDEDDTNKTTPTSTSSFCYSLTASSTTYNPIVGGNEIAEGDDNEDYFYEVILPFHFTFCDSTFDTLFISYGGYSPTFKYVVYPTYTDAREYELMPFGAINIDTDNSTKLIYETTGIVGDRITTIEWKNFIYEEPFTSVISTFNFQIKLYENGNKVEFHYGANDITTDSPAVDLSLLAVGLYAGDVNVGLFLSGDSSSPNTSSTAGENELSTWPIEGTKYLFQ